MNLEQELRRTLKRKPAPPDFANRVVASIGEHDDAAASIGTSSGRRASRWLTAAAIVLITVGGVRYYQYQQTAAEAERVQQDVRLALQITGEKLALIQRMLQESHK